MHNAYKKFNATRYTEIRRKKRKKYYIRRNLRFSLFGVAMTGQAIDPGMKADCCDKCLEIQTVLQANILDANVSISDATVNTLDKLRSSVSKTLSRCSVLVLTLDVDRAAWTGSTGKIYRKN